MTTSRATDGYLLLGAPSERPFDWRGRPWTAGQFSRQLRAGLNLVGVPYGVATTATEATLAELAGAAWVVRASSSAELPARFRIFIPELSPAADPLVAGRAYLLSLPAPRLMTLPGE